MNPNERSSLIVAAMISIAVHAVAVVYTGQSDALDEGRQQAAARVMHISLAPARPVIPEPELQMQPAPQPEPRAEPGPLPRIKPAPKHMTTRIKPLPQAISKPLPTTDELLESAQPIENQAALSGPADAPVDKPVLERLLQQSVRESYLQRLLAHIDRHKFYPRSARRRGMEGEVRVSFFLQKDGGITDLQVSGASRVLRKAAKQAVQAVQESRSLPLPPASMSLPDKIRFSMAYRLES